jgi:hypothetical protein
MDFSSSVHSRSFHLLPVFVNKVLLEHSHVHSLMCSCRLQFSCSTKIIQTGVCGILTVWPFVGNVC